MSDRETILKILDLARWAPSGDNTQPWRFEIVSEDQIVVHGSDTRDWCVYDFNGYASQIAHGALLETLRIAASAFGLVAHWNIRPNSAETAPLYDVKFVAGAHDLQTDPRFHFVEKRSVQRRPMKFRRLPPGAANALSESVDSPHYVKFFHPLRERFSAAKLLWNSAGIRLTCPEAYEVHKRVINWKERYSEYGIPERAVGVDPITARLMRWVMQSWQRVEFFNRYLAGTIAPRLQLDVAPALACSAHVAVLSSDRLDSLHQRVRAGIVMQRLWLTASSLGLQLQPQMTPVIFRWYARGNQALSSVTDLNTKAHRVADQFEKFLGIGRDDTVVFFCRVGISIEPTSRSLRLPLKDLIVTR